MPIRERVVEEFDRRFGARPAVLVRAPGRVNLIGEHTDYNDGYVLPMAIDRAVWIALDATSDTVVDVVALDMNERGCFDLNGLRERGDQGWLEYLKGTAWALQGAGHTLRSWRGVMAGDIPVGAGLSSSAALEMATARAFAWAGALAWDAAAMARLGQKAENQWVGVNCGIMDQMICAAGRQDHALLLDCRSLQYQLAPLPSGATVVILDTGTRRGLVDSAYNERRAQCEEAARRFGVKALRDVDPVQMQDLLPRLDAVTARRARHVVTEIARTVEAAAAMYAGDAAALGRLMDLSHRSLREDFEVSSPALDTMVEKARQHRGCLGARMTGAGFGGCAVALVDAARAECFAADTASAYIAATGNEPAVYVCRATAGALVEPA